MNTETKQQHPALNQTRTCIVCEKEFAPNRPWQYLCKNPACRREQKRRDYKEFREYKRNREAFRVWLSEQASRQP